ncbi:MAG: PEP-CTERM sorting domain-containing protein, partial [Candidatus Acidiferrales bacterium]
MKIRIPAALVFALFLLLSAGRVRADGNQVLAYTLTGPVNATFELPVNFTVGAGNYYSGEVFIVTPTDLLINGAPAPSGDSLIFYNSSMDGAFADWDDNFSLTGPQLYTGPENAPTLSYIPGNIPLVDFFTGADYNLTIAPVSTPEPSSLLLMGAGLLSLFLMRRNKVT